MALDQTDLIAAAEKLWGPPTSKQGNEWRFGAHGSKSIDIKDLVWYDHELEVGGGVVDLCAQAGIKPNGHDANENAWTIYDYQDEKSELLFQVVRKPGHKFLQRRGPSGPWNLKGVRRVLYRLPELLASSGGVFVCEGEKDVDNLRALGVAATTNPGGAGKWRSEYGIFLKDRDVVILPDNDVAGISHAHQVKKLVSGIAKSVRILHLPDLPEKGDVSDWIAAGHDAADLAELLFDLKEEVDLDETADWLGLCAVTKNGEPLPTLENMLIGLRNDTKYKDRLSFNEMLRAPMVTNSAPVAIEDNDITDIQEYFQIAGLKKISRDTVRQAVVGYASDHPYHPIREYLNNLQWDQQPRSLVSYLGAAGTDYNKAICSMFLISMVARIFRPGCKVDHMLVLEGPQGVRKSTACRVLFGDEYFSDDLPDISQKDAKQHLRGKWGIEIAEMHVFGKVESSHLKSFISRQTERYRPPYGHMEVDEQRQCVFIGTTNKDTYLKDETGGRRFWPLITGEIDIEGLKRDRNQLLAQAVAEFKNEVPWWPDHDFEEGTIAGEQAARYDQDAWFSTVQEYVNGSQATAFSIAQVARGALEMSPAHVDRGVQLRLANILRELKCKQKHRGTGNVWVKPGLFEE
jgi:predicted P-loop ATPase